MLEFHEKPKGSSRRSRSGSDTGANDRVIAVDILEVDFAVLDVPLSLWRRERFRNGLAHFDAGRPKIETTSRRIS